MRSRILTALLTLITIATIASAILKPRGSYVIDHDFSWITVVNLSWNAVHIWRNDIGTWWFVGIIFATSFIWFRQKSNTQYAVLGATSFTTALLVLFGQDPVILRAISCVPLLFAAIAAYGSGESDKKLTLVVSAFLVAITALQLAPFFAVVIALMTLCFSDERKGRFLSRDFSIVVYPILFLPLLFVPDTIFPTYPAYAHIAADDGVPGFIQPLIGEGVPIPIIDRQAQKLLFYIPSMWLFLAALYCRITNRKHPLALAGFLFSIFVALDVFAPESVSLISPLQALVRILPGTFLVSLLPITFAFVALILYRIAAEKKSFFLFSLLIFGSVGMASPFRWPLKTGLLVSHSAVVATRDTNELVSGKNELTKAELERKFLLSPSGSLFSSIGLKYYERIKQLQNIRFHSFRGIHFTLLTSGDNSPENLRKMVDGNPGTRWSQGKGVQSGREWILMKFDEPLELAGLEVSPGNFQTDFPRGLTILSGDSCEGTVPTNMPLSEIVNYPSWQGAIGITPTGYPFYTNESNVEVIFPSLVLTKCLLIKQTGKNDNFDWSVAEIRMLRLGDMPES